ncbi:lactonase family protein [Paenibacillus pinistramenti]|uniref:lactonase family protein n=1 Tax=Paenibacillus pinistramenti TaxID=1768003 RepID=UPI001108B2B4|nr:lactonase family protein [Paenibacillus pinistramenti]
MPAQSDSNHWKFYIGTYSAADQPGIHLASVDQGTGEMHILSSTAGVENPSFLAVHPEGRNLYAVTETEEGEVVSYAIGEDGKLTEQKRLPTGGEHPCHVAFAPDSYLVTVNYSGAQVSSYKLDETHSLEALVSRVQHTGSGPNSERQEKAHTHSAIPDAQGRFVYVSDLGQDKIVIYKLAEGRLEPHEEVKLAGGTGPRHFVIDREGKRAYGIDELSSTITVYALEAEEGRLTPIQRISTLPEHVSAQDCTAADLHFSVCGSYLYGSNRGGSDSLVRFVVDRESGKLGSPAWFDCGGKTPRNFAVVNERLLLCANQDGGGISSFFIDPASGALTATGYTLKVGKPVCIAGWRQGSPEEKV